MRSFRNLFPEITSYENIFLAYQKAIRSKRFKSEILEFSFNLERNLQDLQEELIAGTYRHGDYRTFIVRDPKERVIKAAFCRDRVVHHALCNIIGPLFDTTFIYDSYACRNCKGTLAALKRLRSFVRSCGRESYALKCDIKKYFRSIDHEILYGILEKKIRDDKTLWLIDEILGSTYDSSQGTRRGIPIGNLTSQLFANVYLNELDHFVKQDLGVRYYLRYVDDFVILGPNKARLHSLKNSIRTYLKERLNLELPEEKTSVFPVRDGIDFLGFRTYHDRIKVRKAAVRRFVSNMKRNKWYLKRGKISQEEYLNSLQSWGAHIEYADSYRLWNILLEKYL